MTLLLAVVGAFLAVTYPFIKRFLSVPQLYLGLTFGWGIPMAFAAQLETVPRVAWLLLIANMLWVTVYDTIYAMVDRDDDLKIGVRSTAILFGDSDRHIIAALQAMTLLALYLAGRMLHMGVWYYAGLIAGALFFVHHLWLIRARDRASCFQAFLNNNYFGMSVFIGILLNYQFLTVSSSSAAKPPLAHPAGCGVPSIALLRPTMPPRYCKARCGSSCWSAST